VADENVLGGGNYRMFFWVSAADAQDPDSIDALKAESNFSSWPGQSGTMKQGLNFQPGRYPALASFFVSSDVVTADYLSYGLIRTLTLTNGVGTLGVTIGVAVDTPSNGHELFLRSDAANRDLDYFTAYTRGDLNGVPIGDLNFVPPGATSSALMGEIAFMRNNIYCAISEDTDNPSGVDISALASQVDASIVAEPDLTASQFDSERPMIDTFSPNATTLSASAGDSTIASVAITDPTGNSGPIIRQFLDGGNLDVMDSGGATVVISATSAVGSLPLTLVAVNALLQFSTSTVMLTITP
jgi:hypothetical protein